MRDKVSIVDQIIVIVLSVIIYLPGSVAGDFLRILTLGAAFFLVMRQHPSPLSGNPLRISLMMIVGLALPVAVAYLVEGTIAVNTVLHELMRLLFCALLINTVARLRVGFQTIYVSTLIALLPNLLIQVLQYLKFEAVFTFITRFYLQGEANASSHLMLARNSGTAFRSGSIFINPNVYMAIPLIAICVFLYRDRTKRSVLNTAFLIAACISVLLTGSRTAVVVILVLLFVYLFRFANRNRRLVFLLLIAAAALIYGPYLLENSRAVSIGDTGSLTVKLNMYGWYFARTQSVPIYWLTGSMGSTFSGSMDSEWGYVYCWYGLFGLFWYIEYYKMIWRNNPGIIFFNKIIMIVCALVSITASVMFCMPIYSFAGTIALIQIQGGERDNIAMPVRENHISIFAHKRKKRKN